MTGNARPLLVVLLALSFLLAATGCDEPDRSANATAVGTSARGKPYVASVLREPVYKSSSRWAKKISTGNLRGYDTRNQAIADGHRPCKVCKP